MIPAAAILATLLAITPEQCNTHVEWCYCMQYIAMQENRCEVQTDAIQSAKQRTRAISVCQAEYTRGVKACAKDNGDIYQYTDHIGEDRDSAPGGGVRLSTR